jgi:hypothetical protein
MHGRKIAWAIFDVACDGPMRCRHEWRAAKKLREIKPALVLGAN